MLQIYLFHAFYTYMYNKEYLANIKDHNSVPSEEIAKLETPKTKDGLQYCMKSTSFLYFVLFDLLEGLFKRQPE